MNGVLIGDKHSYRDFGLILSEKTISHPQPKTNSIDIPLRDGTLDITESITGDVKYHDRKITLTFSVVDARRTWVSKISEISNYLHGKRLKLIFDDDLAFYYIGRVSINQWQTNKSIGKLVVEVVAEPYKYDITSSSVDWEWDSLDFNSGIINETGGLTVNGRLTVELICRKKRSTPTFIASADMTVTFGGKTYNLRAGSRKVYEIILGEGINELTFTGKGTISIDYTGGSL